MNFHPFSLTKGLFFSLLILGLGSSALIAAADEPCLNDTEPECILLNSLWNTGTAAGNNLAGYEDWYRNADHDHAAINRTLFPQISDYGTVAYNFQKEIVDAPRIVIGNASLAASGLYGLVRYSGMPGGFGTADTTVSKLYNQYRASQTYWYPAADITNLDYTARDLNTGVFPYANQSVGKSGSELDEITKYFHTLAAFKPAVKTKLTDEGLLIPTLQMIYRRTRVANDGEYLSGLAHPSAFDDFDNDVAMINMAQAMDTTNIPPMIQLVVEEENYGDTHLFRYSDPFRSEKLFTSPAAISRIFRGPDYTKRMVVNASTSFDSNSLPLSYHFAILRGDPNHVRITPLNASGSRVAIEIDYHPEALDLNSNRIYNETANPKIHRLSNLVIIGAFVNNGSYYSAPGFISSFSLRNETRTYDGSNLLTQITYTDEGDIDANDISRNHAWESDHYRHDFNRRLTGWTRNTAGALTEYTAEGLLLDTSDADGRPQTATEVGYSFSGDITATPSTNTYAQMDYEYFSVATPIDTPFIQAIGPVGSSLVPHYQPAHGIVTIDTASDPDNFTYTPDAGFTGIDVITVKEIDPALVEARLHKIRIAVGPTDTIDPATPTGLTVYGASSTEALLSWPHTTDNMEVLGYHIYRDSSLIGTSYTTTTFSDTNVTPGSSYNYTVTAFDDAGNESPASAVASGGSATLWGQDDFEDGNYTTADPALINGLTWTLDSGSVQLTTPPEQSGTWAKVGVASASITKFMVPATLPAPFLIEFHDAQQYATDSMGLIFLYQDANNFYTLEITRDVFALHRTMGGVTTTIGTADALKMQHTICDAKFSVQVINTGGAVTFEITKSEWTTSYNPTVTSPGSQTVYWQDNDATAATTFTSGRIGFYQDQLSNWNVAYYDNILISSLADDGPDRDANGLPDAYERAVFGDVGTIDGAPDNDYDGDFKDTLSEYQAGTDPKDATSLFEILSGGINSSTSDFELSWSSVAGKAYEVQSSTTLQGNSWSPITGLDNEAATPPTNNASFAPDGGDNEFYRVKVK